MKKYEIIAIGSGHEFTWDFSTHSWSTCKETFELTHDKSEAIEDYVNIDETIFDEFTAHYQLEIKLIEYNSKGKGKFLHEKTISR